MADGSRRGFQSEKAFIEWAGESLSTNFETNSAIFPSSKQRENGLKNSFSETEQRNQQIKPKILFQKAAKIRI